MLRNVGAQIGYKNNYYYFNSTVNNMTGVSSGSAKSVEVLSICSWFIQVTYNSKAKCKCIFMSAMCQWSAASSTTSVESQYTCYY